jgi:hypothetical protein
MGCWSPQQAAAAKVRDFQSRLMVAALRCKAMGYDVLAPYNEFIRRNHEALQTTNGLIRAQFETGYGKQADLYYDRFATSLANRYGGEAANAEICDQTASAAQEGAAAAGDFGKLAELADRYGSGPELPGGVCAETRAAAPVGESPVREAVPVTPAKTFGAAMEQALAAVSDPPPNDDAPPASSDGPAPVRQPK